MEQAQIIKEIDKLKANQTQIMEMLAEVKDFFNIGRRPSTKGQDSINDAVNRVIKLSEKRRGIRKIGENKWKLDITVGRGYRTQVNFQGTEGQAQIAFLKAKKELIKKHKVDLKMNDPFSIGEVAEDYIRWVDNEQAPKTARDKKRMLMGYILPFFGQMYFDFLDISIIDAYKAQRLAVPKEAESGHQSRDHVLSNMWKWAHERGKTVDPPFRMKYLKYKRPLPHVLSKAEIVAISNAAGPLRRALLFALYYTGMRFNEATGLTFNDVDLFESSDQGAGQRIKDPAPAHL